MHGINNDEPAQQQHLNFPSRGRSRSNSGASTVGRQSHAASDPPASPSSFEDAMDQGDPVVAAAAGAAAATLGADVISAISAAVIAAVNASLTSVNASLNAAADVAADGAIQRLIQQQ